MKGPAREMVGPSVLEMVILPQKAGPFLPFRHILSGSFRHRRLVCPIHSLPVTGGGQAYLDF
jgi:hypothetical protein